MKKNIVLAALVGAIIGGATVGTVSREFYVEKIHETIDLVREENTGIEKTQHYVKDGYEYWETAGNTVRVATDEAEPIRVVVAKDLFE